MGSHQLSAVSRQQEYWTTIGEFRISPILIQHSGFIIQADG